MLGVRWGEQDAGWLLALLPLLGLSPHGKSLTPSRPGYGRVCAVSYGPTSTPSQNPLVLKEPTAQVVHKPPACVLGRQKQPSHLWVQRALTGKGVNSNGWGNLKSRSQVQARTQNEVLTVHGVMTFHTFLSFCGPQFSPQ